MDPSSEALHRIDRLTDRQVGDLHRLYLGEWWTNRRGLDDVRRMVEHAQILVGFAERSPDGRLVGFVRVITDFVYKGLVLDVIVDPAYRGTGLGTRLMDEVVEHPQLRDVSHLELYCRPELEPFYQRWGFTSDLGVLRFMRRGGSPVPPS
jgi:GNAT superfamily N-acetyltransferase